MERAYAQALWQIIEKGTSPADAVSALHDALKRSGKTALLPKIARAFIQLAERKRAHHGVTLVVAREKDATRALTEASHVLANVGITAKDVVVKTDDSIIGGWRIEGREQLVDASYKKHLLAIYSHATNA